MTSANTSSRAHGLGKSRIIGLRDVLERVPLSKAQLKRLEDQGLFPRRVKIGRWRVGFLEDEIDAWVEARAAERGHR